MNKIIISGNLTKDMEVTVTKSDVTVGTFTVAVTRGFGEKAVTNFIPCTLFGSRNESLQKFLLKGVKVLVEGIADYKSVQDDEGNWKNYFKVIVNDIEILKFVDQPEEEQPKKKTNFKKNYRK